MQNGGFAFDYFIKDHLGNVRATLTDEKAQKIYIATLEEGRRQEEEQIFTGLAALPKPSAFDNDIQNEEVNGIRATSTQTVIGAGLLLKVMAGDRINAAVFARYNRLTLPIKSNWCRPKMEKMKVVVNLVWDDNPEKVKISIKRFESPNR